MHYVAVIFFLKVGDTLHTKKGILPLSNAQLSDTSSNRVAHSLWVTDKRLGKEVLQKWT